MLHQCSFVFGLILGRSLLSISLLFNLGIIINGVTAAPIMAFMMLRASSRKVMGKFALPLYLKVFGWALPW